jgi:hypothetical protein
MFNDNDGQCIHTARQTAFDILNLLKLKPAVKKFLTAGLSNDCLVHRGNPNPNLLYQQM